MNTLILFISIYNHMLGKIYNKIDKIYSKIAII